MKQPSLALALCAALAAAGCARLAQLDAANVPHVPHARQAAPLDGWAAQAGGTRGGAEAPAANVFTVRDAAQLRAALAKPAAGGRIMQVDGIIDMSEGRPYLDHADQSKRGRVVLPSDTTLVGLGRRSGFIEAHLLVSNVSQVVIRNLHLRNPCDVGPRWDPKDGDGNWNSEFDAISIVAAHHVWVDRNSFTDAPLTDDRLPLANGKTMQCHDGALDIRDASDYVTVSYNHFALHAKNMLIGASDQSEGDSGHLRITLDHNLFEYIASRAPRVRFGQVHLFNNYHVGERKHPAYPHGYSVGVARRAQIVSQANAFEIVGARSCRDAIKPFASGQDAGSYSDAGSLLNGAPLDGCGAGAAPSFSVPYPFAPLAAADVPAHVRAHAGAGRQGFRAEARH